MDQLAVEVDVLPGQAQQLAEAHAGIESGHKEWPVVGQALSEERRDLFMVEDTLVAAISYCVLGLSWVNRLIDEYVVNLGFDEACQRLRQGGGFLSRLQDGQVQHYLRVLGLALTVLLLLLSWGCGK